MKSKKGYTFVELLLTIGIMAIVLGSVGGILIRIVKVNQKSRMLTEMNNNADTVFNRFQEDLRKASDIKCNKHLDPSNSNTPCIAVDYYLQYNQEKSEELRHLEFGYKQGNENCETNEPNGYFYYKEFNTADPTVSDSITNYAKDSGVNVKDVEFEIGNTGNSTSVSLKFNVTPSVCFSGATEESKENVSQSYSGFVISRID